MNHVTRTGVAFLMALFAILVILPSKATGLSGYENPAQIAGWLDEAVEDHIRQALAGPGKTIESVKISLPERYTAPTHYDNLEINIPQQNRLGNRIFLSVKFTKNGDTISRVNAMALVRVTIETVTANRDLAVGTMVTDGDIQMEKKVIGAGYSNIITDPSLVVGKQVDRKIHAGSPFMKNSVSLPKLVRLGDVVTVVAQSGSLTITTLGRAKEDGDRGAWISIINIESKKIITAQVTGPGTVRVEF